MFGWTESEVLGQLNPIIPPETTIEYERSVARLLAGSAIRGKEVLLQRKDGRRIEVSLWGAPIQTEEGQTVGITAILEDITSRKENERELEASQAKRMEMQTQLLQREERMRLAFDAAKIGFWDWDMVTGRQVWSAIAKQQLGLPVNSSTNFEALMAAVYPADRGRMQEAIDSAVRDHSDYAVEYRTRWPDGSLHWRSARGRAFYDATDRPVRMTGINVDIDARQFSEGQMALQSAALEAAANGVVITDQHGTIVWVKSCVYDNDGLQQGRGIRQESSRVEIRRATRRLLCRALVNHLVRQSLAR